MKRTIALIMLAVAILCGGASINAKTTKKKATIKTSQSVNKSSKSLNVSSFVVVPKERGPYIPSGIGAHDEVIMEVSGNTVKLCQQ